MSYLFTMQKNGSVAVFLLFFSSLSVAQSAPIPNRVFRFQDISKEAGLTVRHLSSPEKRYLIESMSGGVGLFDCDNDGKLDIVVVNGSSVDRFRKGGDPMVTLYHQEADLKFKDITQQAGLTHKGWGMGVAVADFDNDGKLDLYVTGYGGNALYRNLGNCRFEDITDKAGVGVGGFSTGAAWGDYDRDGFADLFVSRYVHLDVNNLPEFGSNEKFCRFRGVMVQCGPWGMPGESDFLFHNRGDGTFEDVSKKAGVSDPDHHFGLGVIWADYDNDGWPDLYVANDAGPNYLYHNKHDGTFEEVGLLGGAALSGDGQEQGSMGVDLADYDHSGRMSIFATEFVDQPNTLYKNKGHNEFDDVSWASHLAQPSYPLVGWGTAFADFDNDGWDDILVANGHVYPQMDAAKGSASFRQPIQIFRNRHDGTFDDLTETSQINDTPLQSRRGAAFGDIDNDGNIDVVMLNVGEPPTLLLNKTQSGNHRALFRLVGTKSNRAAIGARITVRTSNATQFKEVRGGSSYLSQNDLRLHFGLGQQSTISSLEISWPSGKQDVLHEVPADFIYTIVEGQGIQEKQALPMVQAELPATKNPSMAARKFP